MKKKFEEKKKEIASKKGFASEPNESKAEKGKRKFPSKDEKECAECGSTKHRTMDHKGYND